MGDCSHTRNNPADEFYSSNIILYDGTTLASCIGLVGGETLNEVLEAIANTICSYTSPTTTLDSDNITISTQIKNCYTISAGDTLQDALETITNFLCDTYSLVLGSVPKSLFDAHTIIYATVDDTPLALTVTPSTIVGRKSTGNIVAMSMADLTEELNLFERDSVNGILVPVTNTDKIGIGAETSADKTLIVPLESATFGNNPYLMWKHTIDTLGDGLYILGMDSQEMTNKFEAIKDDNSLIIGTSGTGAGTTSQRVRLYHTDVGAEYWDIEKDGADSNSLKWNYNGTNRMSLATGGNWKLDPAGNAVSIILDEDNMASDSVVALCTQQSIKAYVDTGDAATRTGAGLNADGSYTAPVSTYLTGATDLNDADDVLDAELYNRMNHLDSTHLHKVQRMCVGTFEIQAGVNDTTGTYNLHASEPLPDNAIIQRAFYDVVTTFVDDGTDLSELAIGTTGVEDVVLSTDIVGGGNIWDAGIHEGIQDGTAVNMLKMIADTYLRVTVKIDGVATAITAGKMNIYIEYVISD